MTTLNEILSVPQFKGLKLLNSNGDLSAEVQIWTLLRIMILSISLQIIHLS